MVDWTCLLCQFLVEMLDLLLALILRSGATEEVTPLCCAFCKESMGDSEYRKSERQTAIRTDFSECIAASPQMFQLDKQSARSSTHARIVEEEYKSTKQAITGSWLDIMRKENYDSQCFLTLFCFSQQQDEPRFNWFVVGFRPKPVPVAPSKDGVSRIFNTNSSKAWSTATFPFALVSTKSAPCFLANAMPSAFDTCR